MMLMSFKTPYRLDRQAPGLPSRTGVPPVFAARTVSASLPWAVHGAQAQVGSPGDRLPKVAAQGRPGRMIFTMT